MRDNKIVATMRYFFVWNFVFTSESLSLFRGNVSREQK